MKKATGLYPRVRVDARGSGVVSQAGGLLLTSAVRVSGLDGELSRALAPWRKPLARHDPAKIVCDLAVALALGGDCLADIVVLRGAPDVFGPVASDPTVLPAGAPAGSKVLIRADSAGCTHDFLDWVVSQRMSYSVGLTLPDDFCDKLALIPTRCGHRPTTPTARSATAPGSQTSPGCSACPPCPRGGG